MIQSPTRDNAVVGVIDLDSPVPARFDDDDRDGIEAVATLYMNGSNRTKKPGGSRRQTA